MTLDRREFLLSASAAAMSAAAREAAAECGTPRYLSSASDRSGATFLIGMDSHGREAFRLPTPGRFHAGDAHPVRPEAVAVARRPGRVMIVLDCDSGAEIARIRAPEGRHFYGHCVYSPDGGLLLATENDYDSPAGRIGVWDASDRYRRIGEIASGGLGPHEIVRAPGGGYAVANGGIRTHPDYGRTKLNLPDMRPNLAYLGEDGSVLDRVALPEALRKNSIRHLAATGDGRLAIATEWNGNPTASPPLVALHRRGGELEWLPHPETPALRHVAGSIAASRDAGALLATGPRGDRALRFDAGDGRPIPAARLPGTSGVAEREEGFLLTCRDGVAVADSNRAETVASWPQVSWDNHLIAIG